MQKGNFVVLKDFLRGKSYSQAELKYINNNFENMAASCIIRQIYSTLGMLDKDENEYLKVFEYLKQNFDLGCNILEIGGGHYPALAEFIDSYQTKISKGTITVIDPKLVVNRLGNIKLIKDEFKYNNDTSKFNLIVSQAPCDKFEEVIASAINQRQRFFVTFCDCIRDKFSQTKRDYYDEFDFDPVIETLYSYMNIISDKNVDTGIIPYDGGVRELKYFRSRY